METDMETKLKPETETETDIQTKAKTEMETETKAAKEEGPSFIFIWAS